MSISRRNILKSLALGLPALQLNTAFSATKTSNSKNLPIQTGPFSPTRSSLRSYQIPDWFRDAKFGIWAHWGPQSAIEAGDWYARNMYMEGSRQNKYHIEKYGHPSKFGYKDTIPAWKAEKFDADYLLGLYKKAGAKYFMSMAVHHDNFDLWKSTHNQWNAVNMGPKKDIVGLFAKAARNNGLRFGVSDHLWITYKWFSTSKGADKTGPYAGIYYDGADSKNFSLYGDCEEVFNKLDWNENGIPESWKKHWFNRIKDLVDHYEPDLLYSDGHVPFEDLGMNLLAHFYNKSAAKNGGKCDVVYTSKRLEDTGAGGICVFDVERGVVESVWPNAWQTDTCIGDWHYNKDRIGKYKSVKTVIDLLVDIVSRNGNLMLNMPLPASGMLDSDELSVLEGITQWMNINSEGIYGTRPWKIYGTSPQLNLNNKEQAGYTPQQFNENKRKELSFQDIRFTTKEKNLYAFFMGWPENDKLIIKALSLNNEQKTGLIEKVDLLGIGKLSFSRTENGLEIQLPDKKPGQHAFTLKLSGIDLV